MPVYTSGADPSRAPKPKAVEAPKKIEKPVEIPIEKPVEVLADEPVKTPVVEPDKATRKPVAKKGKTTVADIVEEAGNNDN